MMTFYVVKKKREVHLYKIEDDDRELGTPFSAKSDDKNIHKKFSFVGT